MGRRESSAKCIGIVAVVVKVRRRRRSEWVPASARSARFVIELDQVAFHVLYLDPISNFNSITAASPTAIID
jgi:hypothetical protein